MPKTNEGAQPMTSAPIGAGHDQAATDAHTAAARKARKAWSRVEIRPTKNGASYTPVDSKGKAGDSTELVAADSGAALGLARAVAAEAFPGVELHVLRS